MDKQKYELHKVYSKHSHQVVIPKWVLTSIKNPDGKWKCAVKMCSCGEFIYVLEQYDADRVVEFDENDELEFLKEVITMAEVSRMSKVRKDALKQFLREKTGWGA